MSKNIYRTILVIGDNHQEIVKKYSADTKVTPYIKMKYKDASKHKKEHLHLIKTILTDKRIVLSSIAYDKYKTMYLTIKAMPNDEYFKMMTEGCTYDQETHDAYTTTNPNAFYKYERCQQHRLEVTGEEGDFSDPFPLIDGRKSYSAHFNDIDWGKLHMNPQNIHINERVWEMVVEDSEPQNDYEEKLKAQMSQSQCYFIDNFRTKERYITHSCSLWYWGVATDGKYEEVNYKVSDMDWCCNFFKNYIKCLSKTNPLITIYEVHSLD